MRERGREDSASSDIFSELYINTRNYIHALAGHTIRAASSFSKSYSYTILRFWNLFLFFHNLSSFRSNKQSIPINHLFEISPAMASGGPNNSCNGSPRHGGPATKTRRRVADFMDLDTRLSNSSDLYDEEDNSNGSIVGSHLHLHNHHLHHHHHPVVRHFLFRTRALCWVPEPWLLKIEEGFLLTVMILQSLGSGRNFGRKIFGILMFMAVLTVFFKFSFLNTHVEINGKMIDKGQLIIQTFKEDWALAQRAVAEDEAVVPKRRLEKISVSNFILFYFKNLFSLFIHWKIFHRLLELNDI